MWVKMWEKLWKFFFWFLLQLNFHFFSGKTRRWIEAKVWRFPLRERNLKDFFLSLRRNRQWMSLNYCTISCWLLNCWTLYFEWELYANIVRVFVTDFFFKYFRNNSLIFIKSSSVVLFVFSIELFNYFSLQIGRKNIFS